MYCYDHFLLFFGGGLGGGGGGWGIFTRNPIFTIEPSLASGAKLPPLYLILERELPTIYHLTDFESCLLESLLNFAFFIKSFCTNRLM